MIGHLRLLVWLRWKYLWRSTWGQRLAFLVGILVAGLLSTALAGAIGGGLGKVFEDQEPVVAWNFVHLGFALVYVLWLHLGSFSDLYDPGRLAPFPVRPGVVFLGGTLGTLIGMAPIFGGGLAAGFAAATGGGAVETAVRAGLFALLILHLQMLSRALRLAFLSILTSRRWRDLMILVSTLLGGGIYLGTQFFRRELMGVTGGWFRESAERGLFEAWTAWTPPGWLARAYRLDGPEAWTGLALFAGVTALVGWVGARLEVRLSFGEPVFGGGGAKAAAKAVGRPFLVGAARLVRALGGLEAAAVARKELCVFFRDPLVRHRLLTGIFYLVIPIAGPLVMVDGTRDAFHLRRWVPASLGYLLLFSEMAFLVNQFGLDGTAVRTLFGFPAARWKLIAGKNAAYVVVFGTLNAAALTVAAAAFGAWAALPVELAYGTAALAVATGLGSVVSVGLPTRFLAPGTRLSRQDADGCLLTLQKGLATMAVGVLVAPIGLARFGVEAWLGPGWTWLLVPFVLAYGAALWAAGLFLAARLLESREESIGDTFRAA